MESFVKVLTGIAAVWLGVKALRGLVAEAEEDQPAKYTRPSPSSDIQPQRVIKPAPNGYRNFAYDTAPASYTIVYPSVTSEVPSNTPQQWPSQRENTSAGSTRQSPDSSTVRRPSRRRKAKARAQTPKKVDKCDECGFVFHDQQQKANHTCKFYGYFKYTRCRNRWQSAYAWKGKYQNCKKCGTPNYADRTEKLKRSGEKVPDNHKPHEARLCQRCHELGRPCCTRTTNTNSELE